MGYIDRKIVETPEQGVWCEIHEDTTWWISALNELALEHLGKPAKCNKRCTGHFVKYSRIAEHVEEEYVCECGDRLTADVRYKWGIYYSIMCDDCAEKAGIDDDRDFDPDYAGETLEEEEGVPIYGYGEDW